MVMSIISWPSPLIVWLAVSVCVLIASVVSVHVLLTKRDVRAALGWIGLTWFSPLLGGVVYYIFGINRVTRRALKFKTPEGDGASPTGPPPHMDVPVNIAVLADMGLEATGSPLLAGNRVSLLQGGDEAYAAMITAISDARKSIVLASYIFRNDAVGHTFVDALAEAHRRGVAVRVLLDSIGTGYLYSGAFRRLKARGVRTARFLHTWVPWRMPFLNMRNHKKLLVVDGVVGFTGGLNIGAEYGVRARSDNYVDDVHARVTGPVVRYLTDTFVRDWSFTTGETLDGDIWWPLLDSPGVVFARGIRSGPDADIDKLETILSAAFAQARTRVRIVTPYFLPDERLLFAIAQASSRGIIVEILIPSKTDYFFLDWAMRAHLRFFEGAPADIYFSPAPFDHAKLMTVDGEWCLIGSSNWDIRSLRLNFEFDLECFDRALVAEIDAIIDSRIARSHKLDPVALQSASKWVRTRDAAVRLLLPYL
jgi:cardiolipin synthase